MKNMTAVEKAKLKIAGIFLALSAYPEDAVWRDLGRGSSETRVFVTGGALAAYAGSGGEYAVYVEKQGERVFTLISGNVDVPQSESPALSGQPSARKK